MNKLDPVTNQNQEPASRSQGYLPNLQPREMPWERGCLHVILFPMMSRKRKQFKIDCAQSVYENLMLKNLTALAKVLHNLIKGKNKVLGNYLSCFVNMTN